MKRRVAASVLRGGPLKVLRGATDQGCQKQKLPGVEPARWGQAEPALAVTRYVYGGRQNTQSPGQDTFILERGPITSQIRIIYPTGG